MKTRKCPATLLALVCLCSLTAGMIGCEGSDTREKVDDTVEEMAGKKHLDRYQQAKETLGDIQDKTAERYDQLNEDNDRGEK
jgi:O-acetyl-ADP-ribose deacetylase (regulator of RNase III)